MACLQIAWIYPSGGFDFSGRRVVLGSETSLAPPRWLQFCVIISMTSSSTLAAASCVLARTYAEALKAAGVPE